MLKVVGGLTPRSFERLAGLFLRLGPAAEARKAMDSALSLYR